MMMTRTETALVLCAFALAFPVFSQEKTAPQLVLAWAELDSAALGENASSEYKNAAVLIPRQLRKALDFVQYRFLSYQEMLGIANRQSDEKIAEARKKIAGLRARRDLLVFSIRDADRRSADVYNAEKELRAAENELHKLIIEAPREKELAINAMAKAGQLPLAPWSGNADGMLLSIKMSPALECSFKKIDLLVYGRLEMKQDFLHIHLALYSAALGRDIWTYNDYAAPDGLEDFLQAVTRQSAEAILGKAYAKITFENNPETAELIIDGARTKDRVRLYFEKGIHALSAEAPGFETSAASFTVEPGTDAVITTKLVPKPTIDLSIRSQPDAAAVYDLAQRLGYTDTELQGVPFSRVLRLIKPDYDAAFFVIRSGLTMEDMRIDLKPSGGKTYDQRFDDKKRAFYRALGWFVVSLPSTVIFGGMFESYHALGSFVDPRTLTPEIMARLQRQYYSAQGLFWASAAVSAGLAGYTIYRLVLYLDDL